MGCFAESTRKHADEEAFLGGPYTTAFEGQKALCAIFLQAGVLNTCNF